jgi:hypothetical protein
MLEVGDGRLTVTVMDGDDGSTYNRTHSTTPMVHMDSSQAHLPEAKSQAHQALRIRKRENHIIHK